MTMAVKDSNERSIVRNCCRKILTTQFYENNVFITDANRTGNGYRDELQCIEPVTIHLIVIIL